jgi:hypothetical protein
MPVEIRELIIRAVVSESRNQDEDEHINDRRGSEDKDAIIQECVRQTLKILKKQGER